MLQLDEIITAHAKLSTGTQFPDYIQELNKLDVKNYDVFLKDGRTIYYDQQDVEVKTKRAYKSLTIANISDRDRLKHYLKNYQRGQTDYLTFCRNCAETGVEKWSVNIAQMISTFFDKEQNIMWQGKIPLAKSIDN